jgi:hypothetical protein
LIAVPTSPAAHYAFDALAWLGAALAARWQHRKWPREAIQLSATTEPSYFVSLAVGALTGAWIFGSLNSMRGPIIAPSHSIAGALAGGIIAVEGWKSSRGIRRSTGGVFVLPICVGMIVGRMGCFFTGLPDYTYGIPTSVPWSMNLGDGVGRHPVQLYESLSVALFLAVYLRARFHNASWARDHAFQAMIIFYAGQRFLWEFLKPYPTVLGPLNVFHLLSVGLIAYGIIWWRRNHAGELSSA